MQSEVERIVAGTEPGIAWSVTIRSSFEQPVYLFPERVMRTASMGKVFLLAAVSRAFLSGQLQRDELVEPSAADFVGQSGLWQFLAEKRLSAQSLACLVGAVSDNLAANVLLGCVGLPAVQQVSQELGFVDTCMLDRIRGERTSEDPEGPSQSRSVDLVEVMAAIAGGTLIQAEVADDVGHWLSLNTDLSMVASAFNIDPLCHANGVSGTRLFNKTGTDIGVRADAGYLGDGTNKVTYAVIANWDGSYELAGEAVAAMRQIGAAIFHSYTMA